MARDPNRRLRLIDGATVLFSKHGYASVTVDDICRATGSAKGSFYHFFRSKEDLAIQLVNEVWRETEAEMQVTFAPDRAPLECIRDEMRKTYRRTFEGDSEQRLVGCQVGALSASLGLESEAVRRRINFAFNHMHQFYEDCFQRALDERAIDREQDPAALADLMLATMQGIGIIARSSNQVGRVRRMANRVLPLLTR